MPPCSGPACPMFGPVWRWRVSLLLLLGDADGGGADDADAGDADDNGGDDGDADGDADIKRRGLLS